MPKSGPWVLTGIVAPGPPVPCDNKYYLSKTPRFSYTIFLTSPAGRKWGSFPPLLIALCRGLTLVTTLRVAAAADSDTPH